MESAATGEDFSQDTPTQRYVSETQRHQNFLAAVAEGEVLRMDFTSTDYQPVDDPDSSYITFSLTSTDGTRTSGTMVMKFEDGMWRISAVKQLGGDLGGGTNYLVPASFEDDLKADLANNQPFFTKLARGQGQRAHRRRGGPALRQRDRPLRPGDGAQRAVRGDPDAPEEGLQPLASHDLRLPLRWAS